VESRPVPGYAAVKTYRCPWCNQEIPPGRPHVVAWPAGGPQDRRHWHTACWRRHGRTADGEESALDARGPGSGPGSGPGPGPGSGSGSGPRSGQAVAPASRPASPGSAP
jgi:hypothetical protein